MNDADTDANAALTAEVVVPNAAALAAEVVAPKDAASPSEAFLHL